MNTIILLYILFVFVVLVRSQTTPEQIHISFVNSDRGVNALGVSWVTKSFTQTSVVRFGTSSGSYNNWVYGFYHTYAQGGFRYYLHDVVLYSTSLNTRYFYVVGDSAGGWSREYSFRTQPPSNAYIKVMAVADVGITPNTDAVLRRTVSEQYTLALIAGDLAYADGSSGVWDTYYNKIQHQAAYFQWMSAPGNHEIELDYNGIPFLQRNILPNNELWYGFNYGPLHVLVFSTEHSTAVGSTQYNFIQQDLANAYANRGNVPYIVTVAHRTIYTSNLVHGPELTVRANIEPLMVRYGVTIAIWGHNHCYERSYPMQFGAPSNTRTGSASQPYSSPQPPIHITVGTGGKELYTSFGPRPSWSYYREATFGYATFSISTSRVLNWRYTRTDGIVADEFYIYK